jgi:FkbM family methyltransferase
MKIDLSLNSAQNVSVHEFAIGEYDGEILIAIPKNGSITDVSSVNVEFSRSIYPDIQWDHVLVKVKTLDNFASESKIHINLIKCDVESFEMSVFKGADKTLSQDKPTIIFECFLDEERKSFFNDILVKYNYYVYLILEQGVAYIKEGFINSSYGLNYLITPVKPTKTFISYLNNEELWKELLLNPTESVLQSE